MKKKHYFLLVFGTIAIASLITGSLLGERTESFHQFVFAQTSPYGNIKSITYAFPAEFSETSKSFANDLPKIKSIGFNTVWFVMPWYEFEPKALPTPAYNEENFAKLKEILALLKQNKMEAILPLDYVWGGSGRPEGIDHENWIEDPTEYSAFETYVKELLTRIVDYNDTVYILLFVEGTNASTNPYDKEQHAALIRSTLGSLPQRLPSELRSKFRIGFHDGTFFFNYSDPQSNLPVYLPIQEPNSFDFFSGHNYQTFYWGIPDTEIVSWMEKEITKFRQSYPDMPLIFGEFGATSCTSYAHNEDSQAATIKTLISYFFEHGYGFSLWGWRSLPPEWTCWTGGANAESGLGIYNYDYTSKKAVEVLKSILNPPSTPTPTVTPGGPTNTPTPTVTPGGPTVTPTRIPSPTSGPSPTPIPTPVHPCREKAEKGDYNCNGVVDKNDYDTWLADYKEGKTTLSYYEYWRRAFYK